MSAPGLGDFGDGWCFECGDEFHSDDTGGYNPECQCCGLCRSCCPKNPNNGDPDDDYERPEESYTDDPGGSSTPQGAK